jgi:tetratricopeptide (TPR) repeat protein
VAPEDSGPPRFEGIASQDETPTSPQSPSFGISIPGYVLERCLGRGGMGAVYLARDEALGRHVALKVVLEERASDERFRGRFRREARAMANVEHPNVVRLYSFGSTRSSSYLVMEYVEGETLAARLSRKGPLAEAEALRILREVLKGLEAAWEKGIIHRDVKPSNVLLDAKGQARVADFGLAKSAAQAVDESALTADQGVLGTPHYLSPEQAQGLPVDFRTDVYSAGLVLFEMLTGERPFAGPTPAVVVARRLTEPPPDLAAKRPGLSETTLTSYRWMVDRVPERRPATYAELIERLGPGVAHGSGDAVGHGEGRRHRRWPWAALALGLLVVGATAVVPRLRRSGAVSPSALIVAVAPFHGPDEESAREGRVIADLVQGEVSRRLGAAGTRVIGPDETRVVIRDHGSARALGERTGASVVVWGEAFSMRGATEIQPYFTLVPPEAEEGAQANERSGVRSRDDLEGLAERTAAAVVLSPQAADPIGLRRTGAAGVGELVTLLAGVHALYAQRRPETALEYFDQVPRNAETLRYRAEALGMLGRKDEALARAREAVAADPSDPAAQALLGDLAVEAGRLDEAVAAHRRAAESDRPYLARRALYRDGRLYVREVFRRADYHGGDELGTGYLVALDPASGRVLERFYCPGPVVALRPKRDGFEITYALHHLRPDDGGPTARIGFARGRFERPVWNAYLLGRRVSVDSGWLVARDFFPGPETIGPLRPRVEGTPAAGTPGTLAELEREVRSREERDATRPWNLFLLGQVALARGRREEAEALWSRLFATAYPATPHDDYARMAVLYETTGQPAWADRAFERGLEVRRRLPQPILSTTMIERLVYAPFSRRLTMPALPDDRGFVWWQRAQEYTGVDPELDPTTSALWVHYWRSQGAAEKEHAAALMRDRASSSPLHATAVLAGADLAFCWLGATVLSFWLTLLVLLVRSRRSGWSEVAALDPAARRALLAGWLISVGATAWFAEAGRAVESAAGFPLAHTDATGSAFALDQLEGRLARYDVPQTRWAAAVAHHLAGDRDRAAELYRSLPGDSRARENVEALQRGNLVPPNPLTETDLWAAYSAQPWQSRLGRLLAPGRWLKSTVGWFDLVTPIVWLTTIAGLGLAALSLWSAPGARSRPQESTLLGAVPGPCRFTPGLADVWTGAVPRGYVTLLLFLLAALVVVSAAAGFWAEPGVGPFVSFNRGGGTLNTYLLPSVYSDAPGRATLIGRIWILLNQPYAVPTLGLAMLAAVATAVLQARSRRRPRRSR